MNMRAMAGTAVMSAWLGAAILLAAVVARAAFAVLPRPLAGDVVGGVLPAVFIGGIVMTVIAAALIAPSDWPRRTSAALIILACAVAQFTVAPQIAALRPRDRSIVAFGAPDQPIPVQPISDAFARLHLTSIACLGIAMLAALVFIVLSLRLVRARP
jgi:hypothetical protein